MEEQQSNKARDVCKITCCSTSAFEESRQGNLNKLVDIQSIHISQVLLYSLKASWVGVWARTVNSDKF